MKKALFIIAALASCMTVSAKYWFGGSIGFDTESYYYNDNKYHLFEFSPMVGMAIEDNLDLGLQFTVQDLKYSDGQKEFTFNFAPFLRYTFFNEGNFSMFVDGGFEYGICSPSGYNWWHVGAFASPGIKYAMSDHFRLEALFWGLYYEHQNNPDSQPRYPTCKNNGGLGFNFEDLQISLVYEF